MGKRAEFWAKWAAFGLLVFFPLFGVVTYVRSNMQSVRKTDLTVYLRAAWAVKAGEDIYEVTDEHGWHYHYPPLLAAVLVPFAQPPAGSDEAAAVPFGTVVVLWYCAGVALLAAAGPWLAGQVGTAAIHRNGRYRLWIVQAPIWILLPAAASSLGRGQVNELVLILLTGMLVSAVRGQRLAAGMWLAAATCIKVFPAFLAIYPLWRRDGKWLGGLAAGLVIGLFILPAAVIGPRRTLELNRSWLAHIVHPAAAGEHDGQRGRELFAMTATDNQSFQGMFHNWANLDRDTRPKSASPVTRLAHLLAAALMTVITLVAGSRSTIREPHREAIAVSALFVPMLLSSPVCHLHYFVLLIPTLIAVFAGQLQAGQQIRPFLVGASALIFVTQLLPRIPGMEIARDVGLASVGAVIIWFAALVELSGEANFKIRLPGYRRAQLYWANRRRVTIQKPGERPTTIINPKRRAG